MAKREAGTIYISLQFATEKLQKGIVNVDREMKSLSNRMKQHGTAMSLAITAPLAIIGRSAVKSFAEFDHAMRTSVAFMGQAGKAMKRELVDNAMKMSTVSTFTSKQVAEGYGALAQAGLEAAEALKVMPVVAQFATVSQTNLSDSTLKLVQIQTALGLSTKDLGRIGDVITRAATDSTVSVEELSTALSSSLGGALRINNVSLETGAAMLEAFAQQGIKGAKAGTALSIVLREMGLKAIKNAEAFKRANRDVFDSCGHIKNPIGVLQALEEKLSKLSSKDQIKQLHDLGFTLKNIGFVQSLIGMGDSMAYFEERNRTANGTMKTMNDEILASFMSKMTILGNRLTNVAIVIGEDLYPAVLSISTAMVEFAESFKDLPEWLRKTAEWTAILAAGIGPLIFTIGLLTNAVRTLLVLFVKGPILLALRAIALLVITFGGIPVAVTAALLAATASFVYFWDDIKLGADGFARNFTKLFNDWVDSWGGAFGLIKDGFDALIFFIADRFMDMINMFKKNILFIKGMFDEPEKTAPPARYNPEAVAITADDFVNFTAQRALVSSTKELGEAISKVAEQKKRDALVTLEDSEANKKLEDAYTRLKREVRDANQSLAEFRLDKSIEDAIKNLDQVSFERLQAELYKSVYDSTLEGIEAGLRGKPEAIEKARLAATQAIEKNLEEQKDANTRAMKDLEDKQKEAHKNAVDFWEQQIDDAISGKSKTTWKEDFTELAKGFGAELAAAISGGMDKGGKDGLKGIGGMLAELITGKKGSSSETGNGAVPELPGGASGIFDSIKESLGFGKPTATDSAHQAGIEGPGHQDGSFNQVFPGQSADADAALTTEEAHNAGIQGPGGESGAFNSGANPGMFDSAGGSEYIGPVIAAFNAKKIDKANKDNSGTGAAIGGGIGAFFGGPIGAKIGAAVGKMIGSMLKWGSQDKGTLLRESFETYMFKAFQKLDSVSFFDAAGKLQATKSEDYRFQLGSNNRFNQGFVDENGNATNWADKLNAMADKTRGTFVGLGEAMEEVMGIEEDMGGQFAFLFAENFKTIDNARLFVQQFGMDLEEVTEKMVEAGRTGEMSWAEVQIAVDGLTEAFKPGLEAVGAVGAAFKELMESGGRGIPALKAIKDIAVEAIEAGLTIDTLKKKLLSEGYSETDAEALMIAMRERGIKTLEEMANASDMLAGSVVASVNANSEAMRESWASMKADLDGVTKQLKEIPDKIVSNIELNVNANLSDDARKVIESGAGNGVSVPGVTKFAKGGLISRPSYFGMSGGIGLAGEAGHEFLMPAARLPDGSMGVRAMGGKGVGGGDVNITVYAPNAAPGMEQKIAESIRRMKGDIVAEAVNTSDRFRDRGGRRS